MWLGTSVWVHVMIALTAFLGGAAGAHTGHEHRPGPGGEPVEFQIAGEAASDSLQGSTEPEQAEVGAAPQPQAQETPPPGGTVIAPPRPRRPRPTQGVTPDAQGQAQAQAQGQGVEAAEQGQAQEPSGTDANETTGGGEGGDATAILSAVGALGSGAANRALGVGTAECADTVVGTWRAQKYRGEDRSWVRFTLHVEREGDRISGTITSRIWHGQPSDPVPGECTAFGSDHTWVMHADGHVDGDRVTFEGRTLRMVREDCPASGTMYAIDHFTGTLRGGALALLNNDGAYDIDEPYTFRRIACE